ncbi:MAG: hypothetical protein ACMUIG_08700 [Thermoplasmatota archaeon]
MRVGDDASISPAGDMMAFAVAVGLVFAALSVIGSELEREDRNYPSPNASDLEAVISWRGYDQDRNGLIEYESITGILNGSAESPILPVDGYVNITIESPTFSHSIHFMDGFPIDSEYGILTDDVIRHSLMVSVETGDGLVPCVMIVTFKEVGA